MALTPTTDIPLGFKAPQFNLPSTKNNNVSYFDVKGSKGTVVMFICNHCPYVIHVMQELVAVAEKYQALGFGFVAINSNDVENYPDDSPEKMVDFHNHYNFSFPYLFDESQEVAKNYDAACTPDISVFDKDDLCVYRGQLDDSTPGNGNVNDGKSLRMVLDYMLEDKAFDFEQKPSMGCNIKWKN